MLKSFFKENWLILAAETLVIIAFITFYGNYGDMIIDSFREAYIPWQMCEGNVLYKDIFCIYPPLAYLINALLFKTFGVHIGVIKLAGLLSTMGIFYLTYKISSMFVNKYTTAGILLFILACFVLSPNVFNAFFPYSYGMLYGMLFISGSIYCLINEKYTYAYLLYSLAICSKYEFILLLPLLFFITKKINLRNNIIALISPIFLCFAVLIALGIRITDLIASAQIITGLSLADTLHHFYMSMGLIFRWEHIPLYLINLIKFIIPINFNLYQEIIMWIFPVIVLLFILRFKALNKYEKFFIISSLIISLKVFFALTIQAYGVYFLPFALISLAILIPNKIRKFFTVLLIIWAIIIGFNHTKILLKKDFSELYEVAEYLKNTPKNAVVAVFPEGTGINFLSRCKSDNKLYSLIPLYTETFGEDVIVKRLSLFKPNIIIINNFDTSAYFFRSFGNDYASDIKKWIEQNYSFDRSFEGKYNYRLYRLK